MKFLTLVAVIAVLVAGSAMFASNESRATNGSMHFGTSPAAIERVANKSGA